MVAQQHLQGLSAASQADLLGDEIARLAAQMTLGEHRLVHAIADFDVAGAYVEHGALTTVQWLGHRTGMSSTAASERVRVGKALKALPAIDGAFAQAELSYSKVRALTRVATSENEAELLELARCATAHQLEQICRKYRSVTCEATPTDAATNRFVRARQMDDGSTRVTIQLPPDEAARLLAALDSARSALDRAGADQAHGPDEAAASPDAKRPPRGDRADRADAVVALAESYFASGLRPRAGGAPHEVVVHVDGAELDADAALPAGSTSPVGHIDNAGGQGVGPETARRLCCDASVSTLVVGAEGQVLDVGRKRRTVPAPMRRALAARDEHRCQFPGCTHRHFLDAHHVEHWAHGGETKLDNLVLLCRRHHVFVHELGWRVEPGSAGRPIFHSPRGDVLEPHPRLPAEDLTALVASSHHPDPDLLQPIGTAGPADYVYIIDLLVQGRARREGGVATT